MGKNAIYLLLGVAASVAGVVRAEPTQSTDQKHLVLVTTWVHNLTGKVETREIKLHLFDPARVTECNKYLKAKAATLQRKRDLRAAAVAP